MNFEKRQLEQKIPILSDENILDNGLRIIAGHGIEVHLRDISYNPSQVPPENIMQGKLDAGIDYGKPIYLDNGRKHTAELLKVIRKNGKTLIVTSDAVYELLISS
ncbi:MAG: hypothetical protein JWO92_896 [Chitinophagaceae bacterium]|nr:hypothetical protein [Chitinophagaceae bacterium]